MILGFARAAALAAPLLLPSAAPAQGPDDPAMAALAREARAREAALRESFARNRAARPAPADPVARIFVPDAAAPPRRGPIDPAEAALAADGEAAIIEAAIAPEARLAMVAGTEVAGRRRPEGLRFLSPSGWILDLDFVAVDDDEGTRIDIALKPSCFDYAFALQATATGTDVAPALKTALGRAVAEVDQAERLTDAEAARLRLAGGLDIKHLVDRIDERRRDFEAARGDLRSGLAILHGLGTFRPDLAAPFGEGSLFAKTLAKIRADREAARAGGP